MLERKDRLRVETLLDQMHGPNSEFGELKIIDFGDQTVTSRMRIYGPCEEHPFAVSGGMLLYRGREAEL